MEENNEGNVNELSEFELMNALITKKLEQERKAVLEEKIVFADDLVEAIREFKSLNPWKQDAEGTKNCFHLLNKRLNELFKKDTVLAFVQCYTDIMEIQTGLHEGQHAVYLSKPSLITYLHEYGHGLGKDDHETTKWSVQLFKLVFPIAFEKLEWDGMNLVKKEVG
jgi:hypothetical protein